MDAEDHCFGGPAGGAGVADPAIGGAPLVPAVAVSFTIATAPGSSRSFKYSVAPSVGVGTANSPSANPVGTSTDLAKSFAAPNDSTRNSLFPSTMHVTASPF